jgi:penicillin-binding protein-related factor A (putative recombinase)
MYEMKKPEAKWQIIFNQYLREKRKKGEMYGFYELKQTTRNSLPFSKIEIHQYDGLQATEKEGLVWKLSDEDRRQKPCDTICIPPLPSFIVIKFPDAYYIIRIKEIVKLREGGGISITVQQAKDVAEKILVLDNLTPTQT